MKKDIEIPEVRDVAVAAVHERNEEFQSMDWNVYLINSGERTLETVLIVSRGYSGESTTSTMRHSISKLPPKSYAKVEFLEESVLKLNNEFSVSFFSEGKMFHKKYVFRKNSINDKALQELPVMPEQGVLLK